MNPVQINKKIRNMEYTDDYTQIDKAKFIKSSSEVKRLEANDRRRDLIKSNKTITTREKDYSPPQVQTPKKISL